MLLKEKIFSWEFQVVLFTPFCWYLSLLRKYQGLGREKDESRADFCLLFIAFSFKAAASDVPS